MTTDKRSAGAKPGISIGAIVLVIIAAVVALRNQQSATSPSMLQPPGGSTEVAHSAERSSSQPSREDERTVKSQEGRSSETPASDVSHAGARSDKPDSERGAASADRASAIVRIGSWNIEWLGKPDGRSGQGRGVAQTPQDLADYIVAARISILALQEIVPDSAGDAPRSDELDAALALVSRQTSGDWQYILFPGRSATDQLCGVAWDARVVTPQPLKGAEAGAGRAMRMPVAAGRSSQGSVIWHRTPHLVKFATLAQRQTDFAVIVVHMKADYEGDFAAHRGEEAGRLVKELPGVADGLSERDLVIIGDTNMTRAGEPAAKAIENAGYRDLNAKQETTHWRGGATDRAFVPRQQPEFTDSRIEVMSDRYLEAKRWEPRDFKQRLSDHYMIVTTIRVLPDDD